MYFIQPQSIQATFNGADSWSELTIIVKRLSGLYDLYTLKTVPSLKLMLFGRNRTYIFYLRTALHVCTPFLPHDGIIKSKHFPRYRSFMGEFGEFPSQRPATRSFDVFFDLRMKKRLSKQSRRRWFETPSRSLWRLCNGLASKCGFYTSDCVVERVNWGENHVTYIYILIMQILLKYTKNKRTSISQI